MTEQAQNAVLGEVLNRFGFLVLATVRRVPAGTVITAGTWGGGPSWPRVQQPAVIAREATEAEWEAQFEWILARLRIPRSAIVPLEEPCFYYAVTFD
jgi:hypothetical protein